MKIGIDACCWSNRRGYGRFTRELLKALLQIRSDHEFIFFCDPATHSILTIDSSIHKKILVPLNKNVTESATASGFRSPIDILKMSRAVQRESLDLFYFPSTYSYFPIFNRCRIAITIHDTIAEQYPEMIFSSRRAKLFWNIKTRMALKQADIVFTVSDFAKHCIEKILKLPENRVKILHEAPGSLFYEASSADQEAEVLKKIPININDLFFLYVGGISPNKNLGRLINAFETEDFSFCKLVLVGDYQHDPFLSDFTNLKNRIERSAAKDRIIMPGYLSDYEIRALLKRTIALILPSVHEGFGLPAVEAMAAGTPVIATVKSAIPEIAPNGAIFIDPDETNSIRDGMKLLLNDSALRKKIANAGHEAVIGLSWKATAETLLKSL